jgi:hypothetical protein
MENQLDLTVQVPADEWAYAQRRLTYLETLLLRMVRDKAHIQEYYDAAERAALRLPGLPTTKAGITARATAEHWPRRRAKGRKGYRYIYHASNLPARAFDTLIARLLDLPPLEVEMVDVFELPHPTAPETTPQNTAPPWVLPLMRLMRGPAQGNLSQAWLSLPDHVPKGTVLPDVKQAAKILLAFGLA